MVKICPKPTKLPYKVCLEPPSAKLATRRNY